MPFTTLILAAIGTYVWFVEGRAAREWVYAPGGFVSLLTVWHNLRHGEWGLAPRAFLPRLVWTLPVTFRLVLVILGTGAFVGTLHDAGTSSPASPRSSGTSSAARCLVFPVAMVARRAWAIPAMRVSRKSTGRPARCRSAAN